MKQSQHSKPFIKVTRQSCGGKQKEWIKSVGIACFKRPLFGFWGGKIMSPYHLANIQKCMLSPKKVQHNLATAYRNKKIAKSDCAGVAGELGLGNISAQVETGRVF